MSQKEQTNPDVPRDPSPSTLVEDEQFKQLVVKRELSRIHERRAFFAEIAREQTKGRDDTSRTTLRGEWEESKNWPADSPQVGLAFSGGGIRSATFNLGVLQKLAELRLLPLVDYLSTVSGGGFIGGWWSSWMTRQAPLKGNRGHWMPPVKTDKDTDPSRFNEPPSIEYLRLYGNYLIPRKGLFSSDTWRAITVIIRNFAIGAVMMLAIGALPVLLGDLYYVTVCRDIFSRQPQSELFPKLFHAWLYPAVSFVLVWAVFSLLFLFAVAAGRPQWRGWLTVKQAFFSKWGFLVLALLAFAGMSYSLVEKINAEVLLYVGKQGGGWWPVVFGVLSGIYTAWRNAPVGGGEVRSGRENSGGALARKIIPFVFLISLGVLFSAALWLVLVLLVEAPKTPGSYVWKAMWGVLLVTFGLSLFTGLTGFVAGIFGAEKQKRFERFKQNSPWPIAISIVLLATQLWILHRLDVSQPHPFRILLSCLLMATQIVIGFGWGIDPNALSLHGFYRSRLVRAYLGASNQDRLNQLRELKEDVTEPDSKDDLPLHAAAAWKHGGPIHIVNTTLNLVGASDLSMEQRQAEVFMLTPLYSGSYRTGYRDTSEYLSGTMTLGTAVATSGAAASPAMGPKTSSSLGMLMTFFNARLGYWIANPAKRDWRKPWAWQWPYYLAKEFLGRAELGRFCLLSDGGHLENLGLYSLVKRQCRYIIVCDSGADPKQTFGDLGNALRMIRIDFGCEVTDLDPLRIKESGFSDQSCAVGALHYADGSTGMLIYIKSSLHNLPADLIEYHRSHSIFPHETTADQFFDEAQFESYRRLGAHIAGQVFSDCVSDVGRHTTVKSIFEKLQPNDPSRGKRGPSGPLNL